MASLPSSQTQFLSSQGFSGAQGLPTRWRSPTDEERPPSCGQPEGNEKARPTFEEMFNPALRPPRQHDNLRDARDEFVDLETPEIMSIEEFHKAHPYEPKMKLVPANVPKSTSESTQELYERCNVVGVRPMVSFEEVSKQSFTAKLDVAGRTFVTMEPQPSKKHAKEEACKLALAEMPPLEKMEGMEGAGKRGKKRKSGDDVEQAPSRRDDSENWVGILNIYFQRNKYSALRFEDGRTEKDPPRFSAGVTIPERRDQAFTSGTAVFSTKKDAQATAAKAAVLWLREQGKLEETLDKRQGILPTCGSEDVSVKNHASRSAAQEVHELVASLGFLQPEWRITPSTGSSGQTLDGTGSFIDIAAHFNDRDTAIEPRIKGSIGEVKNCFGKTQAKKACAERVLPVLLEITRNRLGSIQQAR